MKIGADRRDCARNHGRSAQSRQLLALRIRLSVDEEIPLKEGLQLSVRPVSVPGGKNKQFFGGGGNLRLAAPTAGVWWPPSRIGVIRSFEMNLAGFRSTMSFYVPPSQSNPADGL